MEYGRPTEHRNRVPGVPEFFGSGSAGGAQSGFFVLDGRQYDIATFRQQFPEQYNRFLESKLTENPRGSSADALAQQFIASINEANSATMRERRQALKGVRKDIRGAKQSYAEMAARLNEKKAGVESGYASARSQLEGSHLPALAEIERGRGYADAAGSVNLTDRGLLNSTARTTMETGNRESADRARGSVYADYGARLADLETSRTGDIASIDEQLAGAQRERLGVVRGLRQEARGIRERTVREVPTYADLAALYTGQATAAGSRRAASLAEQRSYLNMFSALGGAAGNAFRNRNAA